MKLNLHIKQLVISKNDLKYFITYSLFSNKLKNRTISSNIKVFIDDSIKINFPADGINQQELVICEFISYYLKSISNISFYDDFDIALYYPYLEIKEFALNVQNSKINLSTLDTILTVFRYVKTELIEANVMRQKELLVTLQNSITPINENELNIFRRIFEKSVIGIKDIL